MSRARKHLVISGRVQGVAFRHYSLETATHLGIAGWIRNLPCGRKVELTIEGDEENLAPFLDWVRRGPPMAEVEEVVIEDDQGDEPLGEFEIRRTPQG